MELNKLETLLHTGLITETHLSGEKKPGDMKVQKTTLGINESNSL